MDDPIKNLLITTGWTCEDLLQKLQQYKQSNEKSSASSSNNTADVLKTNGSCTSNNVINLEETKPSGPVSADENVFKKPAVPPLRLNNHLLNRKRLKLIQLQKNKIIRKYRKRYRSNKHRELESESDLEDNSRKDEEEVRSQIKMQLELLRNRKKDTPIATSLNKDFINRSIPESRKKRLTNNVLNTNVKKTTRYFSESKAKTTEQNECNSSKLNDVLLSNESGFLIIDVIGGYKSPSPPPEEVHSGQEIEQEEKIFNNSGASLPSPIKLTKTCNITKIKGWRTKKFNVSQQTSENVPSLPTVDEAVPSCSNIGNNSPIQNTQSEDEKTSTKSTEDKSQSKESPKSAFISNALDEFLNEHSKLNISYEVPKLEAEQGMTQNFTDTSLPKVPTKPENDIESLLAPKREEIYKPKTLAEKRKLLQKEHAAYSKSMDKNSNNPALELTKKIDNKNEHQLYYCPIYYNGKKLRIPVKSPRRVPFYVNRTDPKKVSKRQYKYVPFKNDLKRIMKRKPSLLSSLWKNRPSKVQYRPGPMCMKQNLQDSSSITNWKTVVKNLPKISLEVTPCYKKPFDPKIHHLLDFEDTTINKDRVEFALSALETNCANGKKVVFEFPVPYAHGQKYILMQEPVCLITKIEKHTISQTINDEDEVKQILEQLLDTVEISERSESLIKEDETFEQHEDINLISPVLPTSENDREIIKFSRKKSRTNLELKRLNVKIIDVEVTEQEHGKTCTKPFCRLGCICASLECKPPVSLHCGKENCMFECMCHIGKLKIGENIVKVPVGTDLLSFGTLNHLEVEAKKNLAPVEREFTQTVIHANDQTIILSNGVTSRQKRTTKSPRRYGDYFKASFLKNLENEECHNEHFYVDCVGKDVRERVCIVKLPRLMLDDVVPFCMVHNLHKCHCNYTSTFKVNKFYETNYINPKKVEDHKNQAVDLKKKPVTNYIVTRLKKREEVCCKVELKISKNHCSRTMPVEAEKYKNRNSKPQYIPMLKTILKDKERRMKTDSDEIIPTAIETNQLEINNASGIHKRKQEFAVQNYSEMSDENIESKRQKVNEIENKTPKTHSANVSVRDRSVEYVQENEETASFLDNAASLSIKNLINFEASTKGLLSPTHLLKKEFLQLLGKKIDCEAQFRLLPWSVLSQKYQNGTLQLWYCTNIASTKIVVTENRQRPSQSFINVILFEQFVDKNSIEVDIIRWLITRTTPGNKNPQNIMAILAFRKFGWEICGICEQKKSMKEKEFNGLSISLINTSLTEDNNTSFDLTLAKEIEEKEEIFEHTNVNNIKKCIPIVWLECVHQTININKPTNGEGNSPQLVLEVPLPSIDSNFKWYILNLKSRYSYVLLNRMKVCYTIGRADLLRATYLAKERGKTLFLKSEEFGKDYEHSFFGIYAVPNYKDGVFIGPYFKHTTLDVETSNYHKTHLVNTELFNRKKGQVYQSNGRWAIQVSRKKGDNEAPKLEKNAANNNVTSKLTESGRSLLKNGNKSQIEAAKSEKTEITSKELKNCKESVNHDNDDVIIVNNKYSPSKNLIQTNTQENKQIKKTQNLADDVNDSDDVVIVNENEPSHKSISRRYFITNVKSLGYIGGYQIKGSKVIDVKWPGSPNIQRYSKVEDAIKVLER